MFNVLDMFIYVQMYLSTNVDFKLLIQTMSSMTKTNQTVTIWMIDKCVLPRAKVANFLIFEHIFAVTIFEQVDIC